MMRTSEAHLERGFEQQFSIFEVIDSDVSTFK